MRNLKIKQIKEEAAQVSEASIKVSDRIVEVLKDSYTAFLDFVNPEGFLKKAVMITIAFMFINVLNTTPGDSLNATQDYKLNPEQIYVESLKEKMRVRLVQEVGYFIESQAPASQLSPDHLVSKCLEYNVDIIFVLSQGLLESHFGTEGLAARTNSVWNVGAFDNQRPKDKYWYKTQDESLEPYLQLLTRDYLIHIVQRGEAVDTIYKELQDLIEDRSYVNYAGKRFASARGYENAMRKLMVKIDMGTSISFYQEVLKMPDSQILAYFKPDYEQNTEENYFYAFNN